MQAPSQCCDVRRDGKYVATQTTSCRAAPNRFLMCYLDLPDVSSGSYSASYLWDQEDKRYNRAHFAIVPNVRFALSHGRKTLPDSSKQLVGSFLDAVSPPSSRSCSIFCFSSAGHAKKYLHKRGMAVHLLLFENFTV